MAGDTFVVTFRTRGAAAVTRATKRISDSMRGLGRLMGNLTKVMAGSALVAATGFAAALGAARSKLDAMAKSARAVGVAIGDFQALKQAADEGGASVDVLQRGMLNLQKAITKPTKEHKIALEAMGFGEKGQALKNLKPAEQLLKVIEAIQKIPSQSLKAFSAGAILGQRAGPQLLGMDVGRTGAISGENRRLGITATERDAKTAENTGDIVSRMLDKINGVMMKIAGNEAFEGAVTNLSNALDELIIAMGGGEGIAKGFADALNTVVDIMKGAAKLFDMEGTARGTVRGNRPRNRVTDSTNIFGIPLPAQAGSAGQRIEQSGFIEGMTKAVKDGTRQAHVSMGSVARIAPG